MNHAETVLLAHLTDADSLDVLAREGFTVDSVREIIPTQLIRELVRWSLDAYFASKRTVAPSKEAITETWADQLEQAEIVVEDDTETDSIMWAIEQLRAQYTTWKTNQFVQSLAKDVNSANPHDRVTVVQEKAYELYTLAQVLSSRRSEMDMAAGIEDALMAYLDRKDNGHRTQGMTFGLPMVDEHMFGIHPGEIAVVAAGSGVGKTWLAIKTALTEWKAKRQTVLWTLENPLLTVFDRMACMAANVDYGLWQRGECDERDVLSVADLLEEIQQSEYKPVVIHPRRDERTTVFMTRKSTVLGADSIILDQLSHITPPKEARRHDRRQQVSAIMYELQECLQEGDNPLSCLLLHQINREGKKAAASSGRYIMEHLAESSDIERAVDFIFTIYQSQDDWAINEAVFQMLKGRRVPVASWRLGWNLSRGAITVRELIPHVA